MRQASKEPDKVSHLEASFRRQLSYYGFKRRGLKAGKDDSFDTFYLIPAALADVQAALDVEEVVITKDTIANIMRVSHVGAVVLCSRGTACDIAYSCRGVASGAASSAGQGFGQGFAACRWRGE